MCLRFSRKKKKRELCLPSFHVKQISVPAYLSSLRSPSKMRPPIITCNIEKRVGKTGERERGLLCNAAEGIQR